MTGPLRDYVAWHDAYDDPGSSLSWRLGVVRSAITAFLDSRLRPVRVVSVCAGDGRDVLGVLAGRSDAARVSATLLEIDPVLAARASAAAAGTAATVGVRPVDAGVSDAYVGVVPADLVLLVGVFGNLTTSDLHRTVAAVPQLCAPEATVVWTHGHDHEDRNDRVRAWFGAAGFVEQSYAELDRGSHPAVGVCRLDRPPTPLRPGERWFGFVR